MKNLAIVLAGWSLMLISSCGAPAARYFEVTIHAASGGIVHTQRIVVAIQN